MLMMIPSESVTNSNLRTGLGWRVLIVPIVQPDGICPVEIRCGLSGFAVAYRNVRIAGCP
jgi:hypothetical protein